MKNISKLLIITCLFTAGMASAMQTGAEEVAYGPITEVDENFPGKSLYMLVNKDGKIFHNAFIKNEQGKYEPIKHEIELPTILKTLHDYKGDTLADLTLEQLAQAQKSKKKSKQKSVTEEQERQKDLDEFTKETVKKLQKQAHEKGGNQFITSKALVVGGAVTVTAAALVAAAYGLYKGLRYLERRRINNVIDRYDLTIDKFNTLQKNMMAAALKASYHIPTSMRTLKALYAINQLSSEMVDEQTMLRILASIYYKKHASDDDVRLLQEILTPVRAL